MTVTHDGANREIEFASAGNTLDDVVAAVASAAIADELVPEAAIYNVMDRKFKLIHASAGQLIDSECALYQTKLTAFPGGGVEDRAMHYELSGSVADGRVEFGIENGTATKPQCIQDCWYFWDDLSTVTTYWTHQTFGAGAPGEWHFFGGVMSNLTANPGPRDDAQGFLYFPTDQTELHGMLFEHYGGQRLWGTNYSCRECIFKGGENSGSATLTGPFSFSMGGVSAVADAMFDIVIQNNKYGYYFYAGNGGVLRDARLRDNNLDMQLSSATAAMLVDLIDCTPYTGVGGSNSGATLEEITSYNILVTDGASNLQNVRVRVHRDVPSTVEIINELTDSGGVPASGEVQLLTTRLTTASFGDQDQFGPYIVRARDYGRRYLEETKIPAAPAPIVQTLVMPASGLTQDGTDDSTVSGYTGISYNEGASEIQITAAHTVDDIYSFGQYHFQLSAQMDLTNAQIPFNTFDNATYIIIDGWTMTNIAANVDVELIVLQLANGDRWVPIQVSAVNGRSGFSVFQIGGSELYGGEILEDGLDRFRTKRLYTGSDINVYVLARLQGRIVFGETGVQNATISNRGMLVVVNSAEEVNYKVADGRLTQTHFRWRNDNGTESSATWKQTEDVNHTGQAKNENVRLRIQVDEARKKQNPLDLKLQYRAVGAVSWRDVG